jgi:hypothetical protein
VMFRLRIFCHYLLLIFRHMLQTCFCLSLIFTRSTNVSDFSWKIFQMDFDIHFPVGVSRLSVHFGRRSHVVTYPPAGPQIESFFVLYKRVHPLIGIKFFISGDFILYQDML